MHYTKLYETGRDERDQERDHRDAAPLRGESDSFAMEKRFVRKDGEVVHARVEVRCVRRADGSPDYLLAMLDDITEQKASAARIESYNFV